ncbi:MAG: FtsX-like permease family protein [Planctomycetia bacterium]|nr:FtsX-like permease family protein [Planctomycetia bacterium]
MYKLLLIWRYLLTRRIALINIVSVLLGVATLIIVNAVLIGFSREMETRIHGALSDVTISSRASMRGFDDVDARMRDLQKIAGDLIEAATPTVATPGLLSFEFFDGEIVTRQVQLVGIDADSNEKVTAIAQYLQHPENRKHFTFDLKEDGYETTNPLFGEDATERPQLADAGWRKRRADAKYEKYRWEEQKRQREMYVNSNMPDSAPPVESQDNEKIDPYAAALQFMPDTPEYDVYPENEENQSLTAPLDENNEELLADPQELDALPTEELTHDSEAFDPEASVPTNFPDAPFDQVPEYASTYRDKETTQEPGAVVGVGIISGNRRKHVNPMTGKTVIRETLFTIPGADVTLSCLAVNAVNSAPTIVYDRFTIVDFYECHMAEYDESFVFVPIEKLQEMRGMIAPDGSRLATQILIKAKPGVNIEELRDRIRDSEEFPEHLYEVSTWRDQQATTLGAVMNELSILNVILFLIIAVAGFGIFGIFLMIVVEKTRDIGILKSLGASGWGVMQIFLFYGLTIGLVGSILGMIVGFAFVAHLQQISDWLSIITGREIFDPTVYMFSRVPAIIEPQMVVKVVIGALISSMLSSVWPAWRAAKLQPVDALRV